MTAKEVSKQFTAGLTNLRLSELQIMGVVMLATHLLSDSIPHETDKQVEQWLTKIMED